MPSPSIQSPAHQESSGKLNNSGFSLLEVIVALAILAIGYVTVLNLFSQSIKSVGMSDQYLKAVNLANSKFSELELINFQSEESSGIFESDENYRWTLDILPYESDLNNIDAKIALSKISLNVTWKDGDNARNVELATLRLDGNSHPANDKLLENTFAGGAGDGDQNDLDADEKDENQNPEPSTGPGPTGTSPPNISGAGPGSISGVPQSANISGN